MGLFDKERAQRAYDKESIGNINEMMSGVEITEYKELKTYDKSVVSALKRTNYLLGELLKNQENG